jgi:hypothetical protein
MDRALPPFIIVTSGDAVGKLWLGRVSLEYDSPLRPHQAKAVTNEAQRPSTEVCRV